jgi:hypothetical protein
MITEDDTPSASRQRFEDYIAHLGYNVERYNGSYVSKMTQTFWSIWQAAQS